MMMNLPTMVKPYVGAEFEAVILDVKNFGPVRWLEAKIEYQSVSGKSWAWLSVSQMIPQRDWVQLATNQPISQTAAKE
jgi:hypothetical protein